MPAAPPLLTLSQVQAMDTTFLREAADYWQRSANLWDDAFTQVHDRISAPGGSPWKGQAKDAALQRSYTDMMKVRPATYQLQEAAGIARLADEQLQALKMEVLNAVHDARADGFDVGEDYSVTDRSKGGSSEFRAARQSQAQTHASFIRHRVAALVAQDQEIATQIKAATAGIDNLTFETIPGIDTPSKAEGNGHEEGNSKHTGVQLAGYGTPRPGEPPPTDPGLPHPPGGWSDDEVMEDAQRIAYGHAWREHWKDVPGMTQDKLADIVYGMLTGNPKTDPDLHVGQTPRGSTAIYKNGILVLYDPANKGDMGTVFKPDHGFDDFLRYTAPMISPPPNLPPVMDHPPGAPLPLQPGHAPVTLPPTQVVDPATLPPWLQNPSPPGFQISPHQSPPIFAWDKPDPLPPPAHPPATAPAHGPAITLPSPQDAAKAGAGVLAAIAGILGLLAHPGQQATPAP